MHRYASRSPDARELVAELEFVWDQVKSNVSSIVSFHLPAMPALQRGQSKMLLSYQGAIDREQHPRDQTNTASVIHKVDPLLAENNEGVEEEGDEDDYDDIDPDGDERQHMVSGRFINDSSAPPTYSCSSMLWNLTDICHLG